MLRLSDKAELQQAARFAVSFESRAVGGMYPLRCSNNAYNEIACNHKYIDVVRGELTTCRTRTDRKTVPLTVFVEAWHAALHTETQMRARKPETCRDFAC